MLKVRIGIINDDFFKKSSIDCKNYEKEFFLLKILNNLYNCILESSFINIPNSIKHVL